MTEGTRKSKRQKVEVNYTEPSESLRDLTATEKRHTSKAKGRAKAAIKTVLKDESSSKGISSQDSGGEVKSVQQFRERLVKGRKELYKDPPVLPWTTERSKVYMLPMENNDSSLGKSESTLFAYIYV